LTLKVILSPQGSQRTVVVEPSGSVVVLTA
jgi:hypothetical protein